MIRKYICIYVQIYISVYTLFDCVFLKSDWFVRAKMELIENIVHGVFYV